MQIKKNNHRVRNNRRGIAFPYRELMAMGELWLKQLRSVIGSTAMGRGQGRSILVCVPLLLLTACVSLPAPSTTENPPTGSIVHLSDQTAVDNMRALLARQLSIEAATIQVVESEAVEWPDTCLGLNRPTERCDPLVTPGHKMTFNVNGEEYIFHTDRDGYRYRIATAPEPAIGAMLMAWGGTFDNGECMEAIIGTDGVAFGMCGGQPMIGGRFASDARLAVLNEWIDTYAPFDAETDFGSVRLVGVGATAATLEEEQMLGRWAQMVAMEAAAGEERAGMSYHGPAELGSPERTKCTSLYIGASNEVGLGSCDDNLRTVALGTRAHEEWRYMRGRFAPFHYETETEKVIFEGMGNLTGEPWQRAILAWARARHAELATGQTSATINTAMRWQLGQDYAQKNVCRHLIVLDYGFAYAEEVMCEGADRINATADWLTSEELAQFDTWLYGRSPLYRDASYIDGKGAQAADETELAAVEQWATDTWLRIRAAGQAVPTDNADNRCPAATANLGRVLNYQQGYCLLVPSTHTLFDTSATEVAIVQDSLMNTVDPRLHIAVSGAAGRSVDEIADALVAEMVGFDLERSSAAIADQQAVVLDNVPGQDIIRRVLIVQNDRLYDLTFTPMGSSAMEHFYATIIANFVLFEPEP